WRAAQKAGAKRNAQNPAWRAATFTPEWRAAIKRRAKSPAYRAACVAASVANRQTRANFDSPKMKRRLEKNAQGLCGFRECPRKRWQGHVMCKKHTLYFRERDVAHRQRLRAAKEAACAS